MDLVLAGRVVAVAGAGAGIGRAITASPAAEGAGQVAACGCPRPPGA